MTAVLNTSLAAALPTIEGTTIEWLSPLVATGYVEYQDASFWQTIGHPELAAQAAGWWPARGGPRWDALALLHRHGVTSTLILVEAKAHVAEFGPEPCGATDETSITKIRAAIENAREQLGSSASTDTWMGDYYQLANRLSWALLVARTPTQRGLRPRPVR
ncbi:MAG: hypothetical protein ACR2QA_05460 [Solirubrobacteraceae bacterium]